MLFNASMAVPKTRYFNFTASDEIIATSAYTESAPKEHPQRELWLPGDLTPLRKAQLSTPPVTPAPTLEN